MKITKRQLQRIIKEEKQKLISERGTGNPALASAERAMKTAVLDFIDQYRLVMGMDPNDFGDDRRIKRTIDDIIGALIE